MTTRRHKRAAKSSSPPPPLFRAQVRCQTCGRYHLRAEACWFCFPRWPDPCLCDVDAPRAFPQHVHLEHALLLHLSQLDYESIDETILLDTDRWPDGDDALEYEHPDLVGVAARGPGQAEAMTYRARRVDWRQAPEYKAWLRQNPEIRSRSRSADSLIAYFGLSDAEADAWSLEAAGYTREAIAKELGFREGGIERLLDNVQAKLAAKLTPSKNASAGAA